MKIKFLTTGGTIDKVYFDAKSEFEVGPPQGAGGDQGCQCDFEYEIEELLRKDSSILHDADRHGSSVGENEPCRLIVSPRDRTISKPARAWQAFRKTSS